ncbi:MAG: hypothetical protein ACYTG7_01550 [Planctomycetota bacterium]
MGPGKISSRHFLLIGTWTFLLLALSCAVPSLIPPAMQENEDLFDTPSTLTTRKVHERENPVLGYLKKRFMDLLDTFSFRITAGPGIRGHARVTQLIQAGVGYMGPAEGRTMGHTFSVYKLGYLKREGGLWKERTAELGISLFYYYQTEGEYLGGNKTAWGYEDRGFWDIGMAGHWLLVGAEAEVRPDEIIDFFTGVLGYDFMDDDGEPPDPDLLLPVENE